MVIVCYFYGWFIVVYFVMRRFGIGVGLIFKLYIVYGWFRIGGLVYLICLVVID